MLFATRTLFQAARMAAAKRPAAPLIAIIGTTGTGKSNLAVDLALRFNGEIINGDAMQMYQGLPIITNKIPATERKGIPHHLLGCIGLEEPTWTVDKFVKAALDTIADIHSRGRLPILVGGTHYYTQAVLLKGKLPGTDYRDQENGASHAGEAENASEWAILEAPTEEMHAKLHQVDPVMAARWHPNDRRKIHRSLQIWLQTGRRASDIYADQQGLFVAGSEPQVVLFDEMSDKKTDLDADLRYPTLMLWTHTSRDHLVERLNRRVDSMYENGLLAEAQELFDFASRLELKGNSVDATRGIYVSIGYKEFLPLVHLLRDENKGAKAESSRQKVEAECIEATKAATRRYAKYQLRWLRTKLIHALQAVNAHRSVYVLDTSDTQQWNDKVLGPATRYIEEFLDGNELPDTYAVSAAVEDTLKPLHDYDFARRRELWQTRVCEPCGVTAVTETDWLRHIGSRRHLKRMSKDRRAKREEKSGDET